MTELSSSVLPNLEPFLGVAFALNLAYIALPRFRYRERIQGYVCAKLEELGELPEHKRQTTWHQHLSRLAKLKSASDPKQTQKFPREPWAIFYGLVFEAHRDRQLVILISFVLAGLLALGTAHSSGHYRSLFGYYDFLYIFENFHVWFWFAFFAAAWPVSCVGLGHSVVVGACEYSDGQLNNFTHVLKDEVKDVQIPQVNVNPHQPGANGVDHEPQPPVA